MGNGCDGVSGGGQKLYLSPILDLYNGEIIAFKTARRRRHGGWRDECPHWRLRGPNSVTYTVLTDWACDPVHVIG